MRPVVYRASGRSNDLSDTHYFPSRVKNRETREQRHTNVAQRVHSAVIRGNGEKASIDELQAVLEVDDATAAKIVEVLLIKNRGRGLQLVPPFSSIVDRSEIPRTVAEIPQSRVSRPPKECPARVVMRA